jgi:hypothetical protein
MKKSSQLALIEGPREQQKTDGLQSWALVELFGHQRIVGWVTVDPPDFPGMVRVDVPDLIKDGKVEREGFTRYIGRGALYGVNPISEQSVRELLPHVSGKPARQAYIGRDEF